MFYIYIVIYSIYSRYVKGPQPVGTLYKRYSKRTCKMLCHHFRNVYL